MSIYWRTCAKVVVLAAVLVSPRPGLAQTDALTFFKNYFVTGGYKVGGIGLAGQGVNGIAQGNIEITGVPPGAEPVAAFLYVQVVSADGPETGAAGVSFHGVPLSSPDGTFAVIGDTLGATPCWSSGGGTGSSGGTKKTFSYRYDVLRMLPVVDGRQQANGLHPVELPDLGNSNATPIALGASLVLIYRDPNMPLSAFVIYDGSWAMDNSTQAMAQTIEGFYDAASVPGELTHIVGSGQLNKSENLRVNGQIVQVNPFQSSAGEAWDNVTVVTPALTSGADSLTTSVDNVGFPSFDCLTWSAVVYRTEVNDTDSDGLLDAWETFSGLTDPNDQPLPDLAAMGASPLRKNIFVEVGYMETKAATSPDHGAGLRYGGVLKPHHSHLPTAAALEKVVAAFAAAPVDNPDGSQGIDVLFDVGNNHQGVPGVIDALYARGGEAYDEMSTVCQRDPGDPEWVCQFSDYPGTVGWKSGFRALRDALINDPEPGVPLEGDHVCDSPLNEGYDDGPGGNCERVFDRNRKDMFHYFFFAHALGVPKAHCLDVSEFDPVTSAPNPNFGLPDLTCQATDPLFHVPNTFTGVGDWGGGDGMVTMGGFSSAGGEPVGTDLQQAGTLMHELGHNLLLRHGGASGNPNCSPTYLSIMNYLFQLRGLSLANGELTIDYSAQTLPSLDESFLDEFAGLGTSSEDGSLPPYRTAWYAPFGGIGSPASRHCNGSPIEDGAQMQRVDGTNVGGAVDWNGDGDTLDSNINQDTNFNGVINDGLDPERPTLAGYNDWANARLNQLGSRRNVGVFFLAGGFPYIGPASLDMGRVDYGKLDFGRAEFANGDFGKLDFGKLDFGDLNVGDLGTNLNMAALGDFDFGKLDFGKLDFGDFDFGKLDFGVGAGDLGRGSDGKGKLDFGKLDFGGGADGELTTAVAVAAGLLGPPTDLSACVAGNPGEPACVEQDGELRVVLAWDAPDAAPSTYLIYRRADGEPTFTVVGTVDPADGVEGAFEFVDTDVDFDTTYTYYAAAKYVGDGEVNESASKTAIVTTGPELFGFQLIKPSGGKAYNTGSSIPIEWVLTLGGVVVVSFDADPVITITGSGGSFVFSPEDPGESFFHPPTVDDPSWSYNFQAVNPDTGENLPAGDYDVKITTQKTGQTFPEDGQGPITITLKTPNKK